MDLPQLARLYLSQRIGLSAAYRADVLSTAARCQRECGANGDLPTRRQVCEWLQAGLDAGLSPATVRHRRGLLATLLRFASAHALVENLKLPAMRRPAAVPEAWTIAEVERIMGAASMWPGRVGPCDARQWWRALLLTVYWTGARIGSVMAAKPSDWQPAAGLLVLRSTKNGHTATYRLHAQAGEAIAHIYDPQAERLFVWPHHRRHLWTVMRRIVRSAGVPAGRRGFGLFHQLRRTTLTYCWAADPAVAQRQADHANPETTRRHYVDPRLLAAQAPCAADVLPVLKLPAEWQRRLF